MKETIKLGDGAAAVDAANVVRIADRRAANATAEQLTQGEKYRAEKAAREAAKAHRKHEEYLRAAPPRGEVLERLKIIGGVVSRQSQLQANFLFRLNCLVDFLFDGLIMGADGINRAKTEWEAYYEARIAENNKRIDAERRSAQIASIDVQAWAKAAPGRELLPAVGGVPAEASVPGAGGGRHTFTAATLKEAVYQAMEFEFNAEKEKAQAEEKAREDEAHRAEAESFPGAQGTPPDGTLGVVENEKCIGCQDAEACGKVPDPAGPPCAWQEPKGPGNGGAA